MDLNLAVLIMRTAKSYSSDTKVIGYAWLHLDEIKTIAVTDTAVS